MTMIMMMMMIKTVHTGRTCYSGEEVSSEFITCRVASQKTSMASHRHHDIANIIHYILKNKIYQNLNCTRS